MRLLHTSGVCGHTGRTPDQSVSLISQLLAAGVAVYLNIQITTSPHGHMTPYEMSVSMQPGIYLYPNSNLV